MSAHKRERQCVRCRRRKERKDYLSQILNAVTGTEWDNLCRASGSRSGCAERLRETLNNAALRIDE